jgi:hypothetical protein
METLGERRGFRSLTKCQNAGERQYRDVTGKTANEAGAQRAGRAGQ